MHVQDSPEVQDSSEVTDGPEVTVGEPGCDALAADGGIVRIRPVGPGDAEALTALYERGSETNLYRRFMVVGRGTLGAEVARLTRDPAPDHCAVLAESAGRVVAVASYELLCDGGPAEFAVFVDDGHHGRGVGTLLLEYLTVEARRHGISHLTGEVLASNAPMLTVATALRPGVTMHHDHGVVDVDVPTGETDTAALEARNRQAERHSLTPLLVPRSVAVVGAGRDRAGVGHAVLAGLRRAGFTGHLYGVNPYIDELDGVPCHPTVSALPEAPDLVIVAVPAPAVAGVLTECGRIGVRAVVVLSAGFGETGPDGRAAQAELVRICRAHGMRLVGPNCLGLLNTDPRVRMYATFAALTPPAGGLAIASQSGAVAITILDHAARDEVGVSSFVSLGNKADVSGNDLLSYWYDDPGTRAVALYLESVGNPRRFARVVRAVARRKPVLVVKGGSSLAGSRAGASHTAAAAAPEATIDALFAQTGVIRCNGLGELLDTARLLLDQQLPAGSRLGIVSNAGGVNVLAADAADAGGLTVPETVAGDPHPVDLGAAATPQRLRAAIDRTARSGEVDAVLVVFVATLANDVPGTLAAITDALDATALPSAVVLLGVPDPPPVLGDRSVPVYPLPERAVTALAHAARYAAWRSAPLGHRPDPDGIDVAAARQLVEEALTGGGGWQSPEVAGALLRAYGIPMVPGQVVRDAAGAVTAAGRLGYPVVLKAADPGLVHKSDIGGVRLGLSDATSVADAYREITAAVGSSAVLVQAQAHGGVELVAGVVHDRLFGSLVMLGLGGVHTDLFADRSLRLLPITDVDAAAMWRSLRAAPLLTGYRGAAPVDTVAVEELALRLGRLAEDLPEVAELDLNPVLATAYGVVVLDVKLRLAPVGSEPDYALRMLREPG